MKCRKILCILLALVIMSQTILLNSSASQTTPAALPSETKEIPFGQVSVLRGCRTVDGVCPVGGNEKRLDTAAAAFLYELTTETVLYAYNPDTKLPCGHLAKIVTAMVALQHCGMEDTVIVAPGIKGRLPASSLTMDLTSGEAVTVSDLLYGLLLVNANDAAVALAEHVCGNQQAFVPLMNQWAEEAGCRDTAFASVHGVDGGTSMTSARDMAKILLQALKDASFIQLFEAVEYMVPPTNKTEGREAFKTLNYMRDNAIIPQFYDQAVTGGIASYEPNSGANLAVVKNNQDMHCLGIVLGCTRTFARNGWQPKRYGNFEEMTELLKYGFDSFKVNRIVYDGMACSQFPVENGECSVVGMACESIDSAIPATVYMRNLVMSYDLHHLTAPIQAGQLLGTMEVWYRESCLLKTEIFAMGNVRAADNTGVIIYSNIDKEQKHPGGIVGVLLIVIVCASVFAIILRRRSRNKCNRRRQKKIREKPRPKWQRRQTMPSQ